MEHYRKQKREKENLGIKMTIRAMELGVCGVGEKNKGTKDGFVCLELTGSVCS